MVTVSALFGCRTHWLVIDRRTDTAELFRSFAEASSYAYTLRAA